MSLIVPLMRLESIHTCDLTTHTRAERAQTIHCFWFDSFDSFCLQQQKHKKHGKWQIDRLLESYYYSIVKIEENTCLNVNLILKCIRLKFLEISPASLQHIDHFHLVPLTSRASQMRPIDPHTGKVTQGQLSQGSMQHQGAGGRIQH